jgi:hypothetical protein
MSSAETDRRDRRERERYVDRNLAEARAGRDRLRSMADQPPSDQQGTGTPNTGGRS